MISSRLAANRGAGLGDADWGGPPDDDEIQAVAAYVFDQASGNKW